MVFTDHVITEKDEIEHHGILKLVLNRAREKNVRFNPEKFHFRVSEVTYVDQVLSSDGFKPDPYKVKAILKYPQPQTKEDIRRFLRLVNYLAEFVSNLSAASEPLCILQKSDTE